MKFVLLILLCVSLLGSARDLPWLGVMLEKVAQEEGALVGLGDRAGLKVSAVNPDGPCAKSLVQIGDFWWKFDGQILISKCQMVVLLRGKKAGDEVTVEFYREGKLLSIPVILGARPDDKMYSGTQHHDDPLGISRKLLTRREEVARLTSQGHDISLQREGGGLKFEVRKDGEVVHRKIVHEAEGTGGVAGPWLESYLVLKLTLDQHSSTPLETPKHRVRYVPRNQGSKE